MRGIEIFHCAFADPALNLYLSKLYQLGMAQASQYLSLLGKNNLSTTSSETGFVVELRESSLLGQDMI
jgi:hypothetical protein